MSANRSNACARAKYGSIPSSNVMITSDNPYSEIERTTRRLGIPFIATSTGTVINRSTSSDARPGHCVITSTMGGERSGYASTGKRVNDQMPTQMSATMANPTSSGSWSDARTSLLITETEPAPCVGPGESIDGAGDAPGGGWSGAPGGGAGGKGGAVMTSYWSPIR